MRTLLIYNPNAGRSRAQLQVPDAVLEFHTAGWRVDLVETDGPDAAMHLARGAAEQDYDAVIIAGGDGSVNQAVNGLMQARAAGLPLPALGILPAGTANVMARDLGLPVPLPGFDTPRPVPVLDTSVQAAARLLTQSRVAPLDVGLIRNAHGERYFVCWAGIGLDAAVTADVMANPRAKRHLGPLYFVTNFFMRLPGIRNAPHYTLRVDDQVWHGRGLLAVVSNIQHYAVVLDMAPTARLDDGLLDITFFHGITLWNAGATVARLLASLHPSDPNVHYAQAQQLHVDAARPQPVHVDAEPFGMTPVEITIVPRALPILAPPTPEAKRLLAAHPG